MLPVWGPDTCRRGFAMISSGYFCKETILADMVTRLSEELRKGKTEKNTYDLSKLPTCGSVKTPKREEPETILADMVTRLSEELRKGKTEKNTYDLSKLPTCGSVKTPKREEAETILADMVTRLSEELRKGKTEKNTYDLSKLPTCGSVKTPKREEAEYVTFCRTNLNEMETHLSKEQRKGTMEENDLGRLSKQPSCISVKEPKQKESLYLTNCRMILTDMHTPLSEALRKKKTEENTCDWAKLPTFSSVKTTKREHSKDLTLCGKNLNEIETHLSKEQRKRKREENTSGNSSEPSFTCVKKAKRDDCKDLCSMILTEIENHEDAWPFRLPVNLNFVPGYTKVIKKPMDFSTIREKLISGQYPNLEAFAVDVRLVFDNCEAFNQDDSDTGRAGHSMRKYFEKKWTDTLKVSRSYNNLFSPFQ
ncbi:chromatin remodeling regulator CECR2-like isoform X4 [Manis pentadactyla]|uniref:chromatin remodeling regulator CECR2-like isoform X4 n=1 Tax=Manis pentadactyla TaxID=143292 RepID=UPI00255D1366|nr:chromatin remodeling regulator CECR2-like isoform X4 [Manis pentadactyla]